MSKKPDQASRMAEILSANRFAELDEEDAPPSPPPVEESPSRPAPPSAKIPVQLPQDAEEPSRHVGPGRPKGLKNLKVGKKNDAEFCPTTVYIRKDTRKRVKQVLLDAESSEDVSEIVESLLQEWLKKHG